MALIQRSSSSQIRMFSTSPVGPFRRCFNVVRAKLDGFLQSNKELKALRHEDAKLQLEIDLRIQQMKANEIERARKLEEFELYSKVALMEMEKQILDIKMETVKRKRYALLRQLERKWKKKE